MTLILAKVEVDLAFSHRWPWAGLRIVAHRLVLSCRRRPRRRRRREALRTTRAPKTKSSLLYGHAPSPTAHPDRALEGCTETLVALDVLGEVERVEQAEEHVGLAGSGRSLAARREKMLAHVSQKAVEGYQRLQEYRTHHSTTHASQHNSRIIIIQHSTA